MFGVCLGLQGMVEAFGGELGVLGYPMHGKPSLVRHRGLGIFAGLPEEFRVGRYHSLYAIPEKFPACLEVTAESDDGVIMGIRHRDLPMEARPVSSGIDPDAGRQLRAAADGKRREAAGACAASPCSVGWSPFADLVRDHLHVLHQFLRVDFSVRMPFSVGRRRHCVQHSRGAWTALPVVYLWVCHGYAGYAILMILLCAPQLAVTFFTRWNWPTRTIAAVALFPITGLIVAFAYGTTR